MNVDLSIPLDDGGTTTATRYLADTPADPASTLILAHGAGAGHRHAFMTAFARGLNARGVHVVTFNFPYMERQRRAPDRAPVLEACFRSVLEATRSQDPSDDQRLFLGGKSMGGRIATHLAAQDAHALCGVVALGYPLHPPGKPERTRSAHLPAIPVPVLIVQGERDAFGTPSELAPVIDTMPAEVTLHVVPGGDHSFAVRGRAASEVYEPLFSVIASWLTTHTGPRLVD